MTKTAFTVVLALSISLFLSRTVKGDVFSWNDADGVWSDTNAWQGSTAPPGITPPDTLNFGTVAGGSHSTNDLGAGVANINGIHADTGANLNHSVNLHGDAFQMSGAGATITASSGTQLTVNNDVTLASNVGIGGSGGTVTLNGQITGSGGITVNGAGTYVLNNAANSYGATAVNTGTLVVNGTTGAGSVTVSGTGVLKGSGSVGGLHVSSGGAISPGNSPGTINAASAEFGGNGVYIWEINDFNGTAGNDPGWDLLNVSGQLDITATSADRFIIKLTSLTLGDIAGVATNFNNGQSYSMTIASAAGGISGFNANDFVLNLDGFQNPLGGGFWTISQAGNNLDLSFNAVPEPSMVMLWGVGLAVFGARYVLRRRAKAMPSV